MDNRPRSMATTVAIKARMMTTSSGSMVHSPSSWFAANIARVILAACILLAYVLRRMSSWHRPGQRAQAPRFPTQNVCDTLASHPIWRIARSGRSKQRDLAHRQPNSRIGGRHEMHVLSRAEPSQHARYFRRSA
jgi:hypothetical protein